MALAAWEFHVFLLFGCRLVQTILRMAMGPLLVYICGDDGGFKCSARDQGSLLAAFSLGYLSTQIIGGIAADRWGPKLVITIAILSAGVASVLTPDAAQSGGLYGLWAATVCVGLAQGPLFPTSIAYLSQWLPPSQRSWASAMLDSGITVGSLVALPCSGWLASILGWGCAFRLYGAGAILFAGIFWRYGADDPSSCSYITEDERLYLASEIGRTVGKVKTSKAKAGMTTAGTPSSLSAELETDQGTFGVLRVLLSHPAVWALIISHISFNFCVYFLNSWSPIFYSSRLRLSPAQASAYLVMPHIANLAVKMLCSKAIFRVLQDTLGLSLLACRRFFTVVGFLGTALALATLTSDGRMDRLRATGLAVPVSTACFTITMALVALHPSGFKANYMDLTHRNSGLLSGLGNTLASAGAYAGPLLIGHILQEYQSWGLIFATVAFVNVIAALVFGCFCSVDLVDEPKLGKAKVCI